MDVTDAFKAELTASDDRLAATAAKLSDADVTAASRLPGWSRGHVLTHLARNADSLVNLLTWARTGVKTPQYPRPEARDAEIEAGAGRPAKEQLADLENSTARLAEAVAALPASAWAATVSATRPPVHPAWYVLVRRLREVELHHVDLGAGYEGADWPEAFVRRELHDAMVCWPRDSGTVSEIVVEEVKDGEKHHQVWRELGTGPVLQGDAWSLLGWLTGRSPGAGLRVMPEGAAGNRPAVAGPLPTPPPWPASSAPPGLPASPPEEYP
ncbi:maleylpyruvate isomerase family mycothiol-dependent enzyme [Streptosporangium carneum]|uniref:Maleylpyruvate isomerase n=1 Tax=Streptosporangium carneum TaxID=47481 RepID=A0A9W6I0Z3_9ACTN|nr:maleylpyruvate isomerase family mycothiol-dependent enzyme [Streptosporangium carneum]GLK10020.1 maleylpyruvate isomerase [Streptosporangium carneum]